MCRDGTGMQYIMKESLNLNCSELPVLDFIRANHSYLNAFITHKSSNGMKNQYITG